MVKVQRLAWVLGVLGQVAVVAGCGGKQATAPSEPAAAPMAEAPVPVAAEHEHEHDAAGPAMTLDTLAKGAVLFDDLGAYHRAVGTRNPEAQRYFDQGLRLIYAFNHDEATRSFAKAAAIDPTCAMCFWGAAITLGPNYNVPMLPDRSVMAWQALQKARALAPSASPVEQALIGALAKRYKGPEPLDPPSMQPFSEAYAAAMRDVARQFPDDADVQVLFAESMMDVNPWKLWSLDGKPAPGTEEIVGTLEKVLAKDSSHPGANHYYIHTIEASTHPEKAVPSADRLGDMMPGAGHLVHMPAHIYQRVGRYADASEANRKAAKADLAYMQKAQPWGYYPMYLGHNYGFLSYSSAMEGRAAESVSASREAAKAMPPGMVDMMPGMDFFVAEPLLAMVRFGKYDELLAEPRPDAKYQVLTSFWLHGHGMALASQGKLDEAEKDRAELVDLSGKVAPDLLAGLNPAKDVMLLAAKVLEARIAEKRGKPEALALWAEAVAMEDKTAYSEPADWFYPVRHYQGAALLTAKKYKDAEAVYRADLVRHPDNGWSLYGLAQALRGQKKTKDAAKVDAQFKKAWANADIQLTSTAF
jgi:tetratricopeptide (TPR) repeat protein